MHNSTPHTYRRRIDPNSGDSLALIIRHIPRRSRVLELGVATGYLSRFLHQRLGCRVDGVELDADMAKQARQWCENLVVGDLEHLTLRDHFQAAVYDIVVCADVLEHLRDPGLVLRQLSALLHPGGKVLISIPNIAYAGVLAELLSGDFRYRAEGLLDATHLRFYTRDSFLRLLESTGLAATSIEPVHRPFAESEFGHSIQRCDKQVFASIAKGADANVYQYVIVSRPVAEHRNEQPPVTARPSTAIPVLQAPSVHRNEPLNAHRAAQTPQPPAHDTPAPAQPTRTPAITTAAQARIEPFVRQRLQAVGAWLGTNAGDRDPPPPCPRAFDILVPVYNAYEHLRRCLTSLLQHTDPKHRIVLLDDASTDPRVVPYLRTIQAQHGNVRLVGGEHNRGFVENINRGFQRSDRDVVILNSDTEVTPTWLDRMARCLDSDPKIGIVSPLSNNATILSVPEINRNNTLPGTPSAFAESLARSSPRGYPRLPTAVGFCMLIRRSVLARLGGFDPAFSPGYGEECDFSVRAWRAGFTVACCDDAYVHHYGEASFGATASLAERRLRHERRLRQRWPDYERAVCAFGRVNPLRQVQEHLLLEARQSPAPKPHVLHVIHHAGGMGGTEIHTRDIIDGLAPRFRATLLCPDATDSGCADLHSTQAPHQPRVVRWYGARFASVYRVLGAPFGLSNAPIEEGFGRFLAGGDVDLVHFQHLLGWDSLVLPFIAKALGKRTILSLHDFFLLCPNYNLMLPELRRCGKAVANPDDSQCLACLRATMGTRHPIPEPDLRDYLGQRYALVGLLLQSIDVLVAPSRFVRELFGRAFGKEIRKKIKVIAHGVVVTGKRPPPARTTSLRTAFLGTLNHGKGGQIFIEAAGLLRESPIRFEVYGAGGHEQLLRAAQDNGMILHGPYRREELAQRLRHIDLVILPSLFDESFSLLLSELQGLGIPLLATAVGAMKERIVHGKTGFLIAPGDAAGLAATLRQLADDPKSLDTVLHALQGKKVKTLNANVEDYARLYRRLQAKSTPSSAAGPWRDALREAHGGIALLTERLVRRTLGIDAQSTENDYGTQGYRQWMRLNRSAPRIGPKTIRQLSPPPLILVIAIQRDRHRGSTEDTVDALVQQSYPHWRLLVCSPSDAPAVAADERIRQIACSADSVTRTINREGLETEADWVVLIEAGDRPTADALARLVAYAAIRPDWRFIYGDSDYVTDSGQRYAPRFRPDFEVDYLRSLPYPGPFCPVRKDALIALGGYGECPRLENYDLAFKVLDHYGVQAIGTIAGFLCHRSDTLAEAFDTASGIRRAEELVDRHLRRNQLAAEVAFSKSRGCLRIEYRHMQRPMISIIIPSAKDAGALGHYLTTLQQRTRYPDYEILLLVRDSGAASRQVFDTEFGPRVQCVPIDPGATTAHSYNLGAERARGEYLLFLGDHIEVDRHGEWLATLMNHGQRGDVGIVGPCIVDGRGRIASAGLILGMGSMGVAGHRGKGLSETVLRDDEAYRAVRDLSAVSDACLLIGKELYNQADGMDETTAPYVLGDVDLCLRVRRLGRKVVWTPEAVVTQRGTGSFLSAVGQGLGQKEINTEIAAMMAAWLPTLARDPAYNPCVSLLRDGRPEIEVAPAWDVNFHPRPRVMAFPFDSSGCGEYRVRAPLRALHRAEMLDYALLPDHTSGRAPTVTELARAQPDTLLLHNALHDYQLRPLVAYRRYLDCFKVFGMDDLLEALPTKNPQSRLNYNDIKQRIRTALGLCDRLLVSTQPLAEHYRSLADDIRVVPNLLEASRWEHLPRRRRRDPRPRVGWAGAAQHLGDLELLYEVVETTAKQIDWVFFGMCPEPLRPFVREYHRPVPIDQYPAKLASLDLDLAVAPLEQHPFNRAKSNLRLLEYGILGWPVVCTDITPYRQAPVMRVANQTRAWTEAILERVQDLDASAQEGDKLRQWVLKNGLLENHLDLWFSALLS